MKRLYRDGVFPTPNGRARLVPTPYQPVAEEVDAEFPFRLTTGRLRDQWHAMSRTGTIAQLFAHEPEPRLSMHPDELRGDLVRVSSRRGQLYLRATGDADLPRGTVFMPMHWGARFLGGKERLGVNELTIAALDPTSRQPELKHCAVRVEAVELPWRLVALGTRGDLASLVHELEPFMTAAPYASRTLTERGVRLVLAAPRPLADSLVAAVDAAFGKGVVRLSGDVRADPRLKQLWQHGRTICNCYNVTEAQIAAYPTLDALQAALKCGTNCGSCLPELRSRFGARHRIAA